MNSDCFHRLFSLHQLDFLPPGNTLRFLRLGFFVRQHLEVSVDIRGGEDERVARDRLRGLDTFVAFPEKSIQNVCDGPSSDTYVEGVHVAYNSDFSLANVSVRRAIPAMRGYRLQEGQDVEGVRRVEVHFRATLGATLTFVVIGIIDGSIFGATGIRRAALDARVETFERPISFDRIDNRV